MSLQIFLQGKLFGVEDFMLASLAESSSESVPQPCAPESGESESGHAFTGRSHWVSLLSEVLPRALLAELGLARILLGSSGGGQFLLLLPEEFRTQADEFLNKAAAEIAALSHDHLRLIWASTENLGDWSDVRKRLTEDLDARRGAPAAQGFFATPSSSATDAAAYFAETLGSNFRTAESVGWSPEAPGRVSVNTGKHTWPLAGPESIPFARHAAPGEDASASVDVLAARATGEKSWGVLRGDVDHFGIRLRRAASIEEHIQLSVMYKQFFAGELEMLCSQPEFWQRVSIVFAGGDDFAVYGSWDALIGLAREMERLFRRFVEAALRDFAGPEGKTITMALALAPADDASLGSVFEEAGHRLEAAKTSDKDCFWLLGRTLEWKQFGEAASLKDLLSRMVTEFRCSPQYLNDLCGIYRESQARVSRRQARKTGGEKPWRYHRRIRRILSASRTGARDTKNSRQEYEKARTALIADLIGRSAVTVKLRPSGRVALEWARLSAIEAR